MSGADPGSSEGALQSRIADLEDAVLEQAAALAGAEAIVTRNSKDFADGSVAVLDSRQCLVQCGK